jgi:hypothetical protein
MIDDEMEPLVTRCPSAELEFGPKAPGKPRSGEPRTTLRIGGVKNSPGRVGCMIWGMASQADLFTVGLEAINRVVFCRSSECLGALRSPPTPSVTCQKNP